MKNALIWGGRGIPHKSFGMLILILVLVRLAVRLRASLPSGLSTWEVVAAKIGHVALYTLMVVVSCMGYSTSSAFTQSDGVLSRLT